LDPFAPKRLLLFLISLRLFLVPLLGIVAFCHIVIVIGLITLLIIPIFAGGVWTAPKWKRGHDSLIS
jgi:hypothetical protein